jgi:hypothetical protein
MQKPITEADITIPMIHQTWLTEEQLKLLEDKQTNQAEAGAITQTQTLTGEDCCM